MLLRLTLLLALVAPVHAADVSVAVTTPEPGYLIFGVLDRTDDGGAPWWSVLTVGAQIIAVDRRGVHQNVFGIATEAWAEQGSFSKLTGIEATVINREPANPWRKISMWATFKNRPDVDYFAPLPDPANLGSQALRIESQPGTGFERAIVLAPYAMHPSHAIARPVLIDLSELTPADVALIDLIRFPDGCALHYQRRGVLAVRCP